MCVFQDWAEYILLTYNGNIRLYPDVCVCVCETGRKGEQRARQRVHGAKGRELGVWGERSRREKGGETAGRRGGSRETRGQRIEGNGLGRKGGKGTKEEEAGRQDFLYTFRQIINVFKTDGNMNQRAKRP